MEETFLKNSLDKMNKVLGFFREYPQDLWLFLRHNGHSPLEEHSRRLSHKTIIEAHTIEKGLTLPQPKPHFGRDKISAMLDMNKDWTPPASDLSRSMLVGALKEYQETFADTSPPDASFANRVNQFITNHDKQIANGGVRRNVQHLGENLDALSFLQNRFAAREFSDIPVSADELRTVIETAQRAPSQCNRQSIRLHVYRDPSKIQQLLSLQGGAKGFADNVPVLFIVSSEITAWGGSQQRNQPYVDGGLYSMMLMLALDAKGLLSCPLNLAISNNKERSIKTAGDIHARERLIMMIATGKPPAHTIRAAKSPRWRADEICQFHD